MHVRRTDTAAHIQTPAKINLLLDVLSKRPDGYHEIETIMVAVMIQDTLIFTPTSDGQIQLACRWACGMAARDVAGLKSTKADDGPRTSPIPAGPKNLIWRAVELFREQAGLKLGASIELIKRIPAESGLGGASSDAAAALVAANLAWQAKWSLKKLGDLAARLGSDVKFFLSRGAALCRGRGERIEPLAARRLPVVIVRPPVGLSTPAVYAACQPRGSSGGAAALASALEQGRCSTAAMHLANGLEAAADKLTPWIGKLKSEFATLGAMGHQMSGSGSSYFGVFRSVRHARRAAAQLRARNMGAVFAATTAASGCR